MKPTAIALLAILLTSSYALAQATFTPLGTLSGAAFEWSYAYGVSPDGSVVVGYSDNFAGGGIGSQAIQWNSANGMTGLGATTFNAYAASNAGSVIVGNRLNGPSFEAFRWTSSNGLQGLGTLPSQSNSTAHGVSSDGQVIVGESFHAFRWTSTNGMQSLGDLPGGAGLSSTAYGVSGNGNVIVGQVGTLDGPRAFRWTPSNGMQNLGVVGSSSLPFSRASAISLSGDFIVGTSTVAEGNVAFLWTEQNGMVNLGDLPGGVVNAEALGVSADGRFVVGTGTTAPIAGTTEAFLWQQGLGIRPLRDVLVDLGLANELAGWQLRAAYDISADGQTIVGWGDSPEGTREAWVVQFAAVPEPATYALISVVACGIAPFVYKRARKTRRLHRAAHQA